MFEDDIGKDVEKDVTVTVVINSNYSNNLKS